MSRNRQFAVEVPSVDHFREMISQETFVEFLRGQDVLKNLREDEQIGPLLDDLMAGKKLSTEDFGRLAVNSTARNALLPLLTIAHVHVVQTKDAMSELPLYAEVRCIRSDENGHFVWKVVDFEPVRPGQQREPILRLKKVRIKPGPDRRDYLGLFIYREFRELTDKDEPELALNTLLASGVPEWVQDGDRALFLRLRWLFRPGNLAQVRLKGPGPGKGF